MSFWVALIIAIGVAWIGWPLHPPSPPRSPPHESSININDDDHPVWTHVLLFDDPHEPHNLFQLTKSMLFLREATTGVSLVGYNDALAEYVKAYDHHGLYRAVYVYHDDASSDAAKNLTRVAFEREELYLGHLHARSLPPDSIAYPHIVCFAEYRCFATVAEGHRYWYYLDELVHRVEYYARLSQTYDPLTSYRAVARDYSTTCLYAEGPWCMTQSMMERIVRNQSAAITRYYEEGGPPPLLTQHVRDLYKEGSASSG